MRLLTIALIVIILGAVIGNTVKTSTVCPYGTLPTTVTYEWKNEQGDFTLAKVTGTLCGVYAQEQIVGPYLYEEDFRELLENKGFVILTNPRPLQHAR